MAIVGTHSFCQVTVTYLKIGWLIIKRMQWFDKYLSSGHNNNHQATIQPLLNSLALMFSETKNVIFYFFYKKPVYLGFRYDNEIIHSNNTLKIAILIWVDSYAIGKQEKAFPANCKILAFPVGVICHAAQMLSSPDFSSPSRWLIRVMNIEQIYLAVCSWQKWMHINSWWPCEILNKVNIEFLEFEYEHTR